MTIIKKHIQEILKDSWHIGYTGSGCKCSLLMLSLSVQ